jgi:N-acetyltransferase 10
MTNELLRFWKRAGFVPTYLRQTPNDLTGEHSSIMIKTISQDEEEDETDQAAKAWLAAFWSDFRRRFINLLGFEFRKFMPCKILNDHFRRAQSVSNLFILIALGLSVLSNKKVSLTHPEISVEEMSHMITPYDMKRLELYGNNMADYHLVTDLLPNLARYEPPVSSTRSQSVNFKTF